MFRRKKTKHSIVKYAVDPVYLNRPVHMEDGGDEPDVLRDVDFIFDSWVEYPAIKDCPTFRKMPSYSEFTKFQLSEELRSTLRSTNNVAKRQVELFKFFKNKFPKMNYFEMLRNIVGQTEETDVKTMRACPNIKNLLTQTIVIKAPIDLHFSKCTIDDIYNVPSGISGKETAWTWASTNHFLASRSNFFGDRHSKDQFCYGTGSQFEGYSNVKVPTGIQLELPDDITAIQHAPFYHKINSPLKVLSGIFIYPQNKHVAIIGNFLIKDDEKDFTIKKGEALFYLTFNNNVKLKKNEKGSDAMIKYNIDTPQMSLRNFSGKEIK
jgi:hypothetical protein